MSPSTAEQEIAVEQRYVDRVYARLDELRDEAVAAEAAGYRQAGVGNFGALVERDALVYQAARRLRALDSEYEGLVFGRLDLLPEAARRADDEGGGTPRYVGRLGLRDAGMQPLLVDWRAPAAAPFYRATPEHRMGVIRRRVLRSVGSKVVGVEDDLLDPSAGGDLPVVGDGALMATLARARGTQMRDIVATIQAEQDAAVRAPASGVTLITGGPGTGKTAVALHRAAYLLYSDRRRFEGGGVLVVGPSPVFITYIERVLPSLGENAVTLRSLGEMYDGVVTDRHDPPATAAVKGSLEVRKVIARVVRGGPPDAPTELRLTFRGEVLRLDAGALRAARRRVYARGIPHNLARNYAAAALIADLWRVYRDRLARPTTDERDAFVADLRERGELLEFVGRWWPQLGPVEVLGWLRDPARLARYGADPALTFAPTPTVEDVPLLDELRVLLGEPPKPSPRDPFHIGGGVREMTTVAERQFAARTPVERPAHYDEYAHVVVDEAQDLSPMQWRMLGRRGRYASWTIVGDPAQAVWEDAAEARRARDAALGRRRRHTFELLTNYRNSAEIFTDAAAVARHALPTVRLPHAVRSTGVRPDHRVVADVSDAVRTAAAELLGRVDGTIGVITTMDRRNEVAGWLGELDGDRVRAVGSLEAKGLEYDGVVVVAPAELVAESPAGLRTLYVVLTRATQRLTTVAPDGSWLALLRDPI